MPDTETAVPPVGAEAPDFTLQATDGSQVHLADLRGKTVLLYFYPKDDTPGCTTEACAFRDAWGELEARGVVVLGVSRDDVKSHQKFAKKYSLPFPLLADLGGVCGAAIRGVGGEEHVRQDVHDDGAHQLPHPAGWNDWPCLGAGEARWPRR